MTIYFFLLFLILFCIVLEFNASYIKIMNYRFSTRNFCFFCIYIVILLIGILRYEFLGVDVANYDIYFDNYQKLGFLDILMNYQVDNGYIMLNKIVGLFSNQFWVFKVVIYTITFSIFSYVIYKKSKYCSISFLIYIALGFLGLNFCILRQAIAVSICFYAFEYAKRKQLFKFICFVLIAVTFHKTALFYLLLYPIINGKFGKLALLKKIALLALTFVIAIFLLPELYKLYSIDYSEVAITGDGYNMLFVYIFLILSIGFMKSKSKISELDKEYNGAVCIIYTQIITLYFSLFSRIASYFSILLCVLIPNLIFESKYRKIIVTIVVVFFSLLYTYTIYSDGTEIVPYLMNF